MASIYLIFGDDEFLVDEGLAGVLSDIRSHGFEDLVVETVDCKERGTADVIAEIASPSLFSLNKATVLRRFQLTRQSKLALELDRCLAQGLAPGQFIILMPEKVDKRLRLVKAVDKDGGRLELNALDHNALVDWIIKRFKAQGRSASRGIAESLIDLKGEDDPEGQTMRALDSEIEKIVTYCGESLKVTQADVDAVVGRSRSEKAFELVEHVALKRIGEALCTLNDLLQTGESPIGIVLRLSREITWLIEIRLFLASERTDWDDGMNFGRFRAGVLPAFKAWVQSRGIPPETTSLRQKPYAIYQRFKKIGGFALDDLMNLLEKLLQANTLLVSTSVKPEVVLEQFVTALNR